VILLDYTKIPLNAIPSGRDSRDFNIAMFTALQKEFPKEFHLPRPKVKNQGNIGCCVAMSLTYCREIKELMQSGTYRVFSPGFIYGNRLSGQYTGTGAIPRELLNNLLKIGAVEEQYFSELAEMPQILEKVKENIGDLYKLAEPYRITAYTRLYSEAEIKTALMTLGPVTIMIEVFSNLYMISAKNPVLKPVTSDMTYYGRHQMTITGWREDNTWEVLNSWGEEWGDGGYCYIPCDYPLIEAWSITDDIIPDRHKVEIKINEFSNIAYVNGKPVQMDNTPVRINNRLNVPIRFVAENLGAVVEWDEESATATIKL